MFREFLTIDSGSSRIVERDDLPYKSVCADGYAAVIVALAPGMQALADAETWNHVPVVDTLCMTKVQDDPDAHTRQCAIQCVGGGYGLITEQGEYLAFDEAGNRLVIAALKDSKREDHLRAKVTGVRNGDTIEVRSFNLE